jgi:uncharacterized protein YciI
MHFVYCLIDKDGAQAERAALTARYHAHLEKVTDRILFCGDLTSDDRRTSLGSLYAIDWPDRAAAEKWLADEPLMKAGLYREATIRGYTHLVPSDGIPDTVEHGLWAFVQLDIPDSGTLRETHFEAHRDFLIETSANIYTDGPLYWDSDKADFGDRIGSVFVVDFATREEAEAWRLSEPFTIEGVYGTLWGYAYQGHWPKAA